MPNLTKRYVDSLKPGQKDLVSWDSGLKGFGIRVKPSGVKSYMVQYRNAAGRSRRLTIGKHGPLTPYDARKLAKGKLGQVDKGRDPTEEARQTMKAPTVSQLAQRYVEQHAVPKKKPRSVAEDKHLLRRFLLPKFGRRKLAAVTRADVQSLHHSLSATPYQANRALALFSKMFNLAERWGLRPDNSNPCRHVERYREKRRERFLSNDELARLGQALAEAEANATEPLSAIAAVRLLILTGCRLQEVLGLRWDQVDYERRQLRFEESKTGQKTVALGAAALELLCGLPHLEGNPYVIPGKKNGAHFVGMPKVWQRIRERANLEGVRLHDLRHSFASVGAGAGLSLPIIGKLLGHTQAATTQRYAHLAADPVRQAADRISGEIAAAMSGKPKGEVAPIRR